MSTFSTSLSIQDRLTLKSPNSDSAALGSVGVRESGSVKREERSLIVLLLLHALLCTLPRSHALTLSPQVPGYWFQVPGVLLRMN